jgi:hypothetical protein
LQLLDTEYRGASFIYSWRCIDQDHVIRRSKGNIQQSLKKGLPACDVCGPGITTNVRARQAVADRFAAEVFPLIQSLKKEGNMSLEALAKELNERGISTARGARWYASTVRNLLARAKFRT